MQTGSLAPKQARADFFRQLSGLKHWQGAQAVQTEETLHPESSISWGCCIKKNTAKYSTMKFLYLRYLV